MARPGDILIKAGAGQSAEARELSLALSERGLRVRTLEGEGPPPGPADVLVCFADGDAPGAVERSVSEISDALEKALAGAAVVVSAVKPEGDAAGEAPILRADFAWGARAVACTAEAALALARERHARARVEARLKEFAQVQESFGAIASHDLRTPVTTLRLLKDLLASHISARADVLTSDERVGADELLGIMARSLDKMEAFIDDMLEAWRLSPGLPEAKPGPVDLNAVVADVVASLFPVAMQKEIVLDFEANRETGLVLAEARRVGQVVSNIVGNALKFTPRKGVVTVGTRPATAEEGGNRPGAVLEVADTGPGVAEEDRGKIFQRFGRGSARATGGEPSTGLGLYICSEIVELYGGRMWFESTRGEGSRFFVFLPGADMRKAGRT